MATPRRSRRCPGVPHNGGSGGEVGGMGADAAQGTGGQAGVDATPGVSVECGDCLLAHAELGALGPSKSRSLRPEYLVCRLLLYKRNDVAKNGSSRDGFLFG